jgi:hypothetical protein
MKGYFVTGAFAVLGGLHSVRVVRISGASAGAWCVPCDASVGIGVSLVLPMALVVVVSTVVHLRCAVFMTCGLHPVDWADTYYTTRLCIRDGMSIADAYRALAHTVLPEDAYIKCSGVVHLSISVVTWSGIRNLIVSEFTSNEDLIEVRLWRFCTRWACVHRNADPPWMEDLIEVGVCTNGCRSNC